MLLLGAFGVDGGRGRGRSGARGACGDTGPAPVLFVLGRPQAGELDIEEAVGLRI